MYNPIVSVSGYTAFNLLYTLQEGYSFVIKDPGKA